MPDEPGRAASPAPSAGRAAKVPRGSLLGSSRPASPLAAAPKRCGASLPRRRGEPVRPSPVAASPSEPGLAAWRLSTAGGPEPAGASNGAPPEGSPALTVCHRLKPSAAQSSRWGGVGRGGEAAIESVASGGEPLSPVLPMVLDIEVQSLLRGMLLCHSPNQKAKMLIKLINLSD
uniref:Uncharacterized protein n=1 Tax=Sphaerodactylus townsendi TaxID=933632 RepID=A0ACB8ERC7_9SAUR